MADLTDDIETNAAGPKSATVDGHSATAHSLKEQIEADRYLKSAAATSNKKRGVVLTKMIPGGTV